MKKKFQMTILCLMTGAGLFVFLFDGWYWTAIATWLIVFVCSDAFNNQKASPVKESKSDDTRHKPPPVPTQKSPAS